jgi:TPR repeat protein
MKIRTSTFISAAFCLVGAGQSLSESFETGAPSVAGANHQEIGSERKSEKYCVRAQQDNPGEDIEPYVQALQQLANNDVSCALFGLGTLYYFGYQNVEPDLQLAYDYLSRAAALGNQRATQFLSSRF